MPPVLIAYKLFRVRKDGTCGSLFINRRQRIVLGERLQAENHPTPGYAVRPGWHACAKPIAPHLSKHGRVWFVVQLDDYIAHQRPVSQGGLWYTANVMTVLRRKR